MFWAAAQILIDIRWNRIPKVSLLCTNNSKIGRHFFN